MFIKDAILPLEVIAIAKDIMKNGINPFMRQVIVCSVEKDNMVVLDRFSKRKGKFSFKLPTVSFINYGDYYPEMLDVYPMQIKL